MEPVFMHGITVTFGAEWESWCDETIVKKADSKSPLKGHSWKTAAVGSRNGGRHAALKHICESAVKTLVARPGTKPTEWEQKAARTLTRLENRLMDEESGQTGDTMFPDGGASAD